MHGRAALSIMTLLLLSPLACSSDETTTSGSPSSTSASSTTSSTSGTGGSGGGGGGTTVGSGGVCADCSDTEADPLGAFMGMFCDMQSQMLYQALADCACQACMTDCTGSSVCMAGGGTPSMACQACYVQSYQDACTA